VDQQYLGTAEEVLGRVSGAVGEKPERTAHEGFGDLAAVWGVPEHLKVVEAVDEAVGPRRADAGVSVGTYLALATTNRAIATAMVTEFGLDPSASALDMTNFATFIDSAGERAPIAQRGHAKHKRLDLRPVGLRLVVTRDGAAPVVFDAGQNSAANFAHLTHTGLGFVGSLPPSDHPDLLAAQARGFDRTLAEATSALAELGAALARGETRRDRDAVQAGIEVITRARWVRRVVTTKLTGTSPADLRPTWRIDPAARRALETETFGKRQLKDPHVAGFSPMVHWTDSGIRVHVFYCVLALAGIQETVLLYPAQRGRPRARRIRTDPVQRRLYDLLNLDTSAPRR